DCYADQAFEAVLKMATYLDLEGAEIAYSEDPVPNQFPENWRRESFIMNELPLFSENALKKLYQQGRTRRLEQVIIDCLSHSRVPVTVVATGPLTNIATAFEERPDLKQKVDEFIIMGGAFTVPGNVEQDTSDGSAEWNMYADPVAAKKILDTGVPLKIIPLDVTNQLPVTKEFLEKLDAQSDTCRASMLAMKLWSLVTRFESYLWDTVTAAAAIDPALFTFKEQRIDVATQGRTQGKTSTVLFGGRKVKVATGVQVEAFENLLLTILRTK